MLLAACSLKPFLVPRSNRVAVSAMLRVRAFLLAALYTVAYAATVTNTNLQTINGIGASGAWWVNDLAQFPSSVQQNVSNLLLSQTSGVYRTCSLSAA